ncbi:hypothetical protein VP01_1493g1 [Puccinia sorghi]|uniref:Uncharacterized protein n=1 Tax=Puccinia sorghi TaxID=27349 RepID=A0A0L6VJX3_9BASI|nr:hypothetical protein VP01_1493g1 [Puccinia sorghi]
MLPAQGVKCNSGPGPRRGLLFTPLSAPERGLKVSRINNKIPPLKWLRKMDHEQATLQRPVFFHSAEESFSFIPTTTAKSLGLGALEGNQRIKTNPTCHWINKIGFSSHTWLEVIAQGLLFNFQSGPPVNQVNLR